MSLLYEVHSPLDKLLSAHYGHGETIDEEHKGESRIRARVRLVDSGLGNDRGHELRFKLCTSHEAGLN